MITFERKRQRQAEWAQNEHTQHYAKQGRKLVERAHHKLIGACRSSQDAAVREALKEYEGLRHFTETLEGKHDEGTDER